LARAAPCFLRNFSRSFSYPVLVGFASTAARYSRRATSYYFCRDGEVLEQAVALQRGLDPAANPRDFAGSAFSPRIKKLRPGDEQPARQETQEQDQSFRQENLAQIAIQPRCTGGAPFWRETGHPLSADRLDSGLNS
jgi:hypothetical protein